jgi:FRG domain
MHIIRLAAQAPCRRVPLSSNVRDHMHTRRDFDTWAETESFVRSLLAEREAHASSPARYHSDLLFRGQSSSAWSLESTLQRARPSSTRLADYYRQVAIAQKELESFTSQSWPEVDYPAALESLRAYDTLRHQGLMHCELLVHLRHHGFPSPLLDWSRSFYVASYFAFQRVVGERVAISVFQEHRGSGKVSSSDRAQIHTLGPNMRTHRRHFLQQAQYTCAVQYRDGQWHLADHTTVVELNREEQDRLWTLTVPATERGTVMARLAEYNISAFSLLQTEDALLATLAERAFPRAGDP